MDKVQLSALLEQKYVQFNTKDFIADDPISIPHRFTKKQDIEIMAFFAAILAWGQRKTIINKCHELILLMENQPYQFITSHQPSDLKAFANFKHRTFNDTDALYFIDFLKNHYAAHNSLESAFCIGLEQNENMEKPLTNFNKYFFGSEFAPQRTQKHVASPAKKSACKRLNMFLRWMVRKDEKGVDFGIWHSIKPSQLVCPCDVHVDRVARILGLIQRPGTDWLTAVELTENLKEFDKNDPVKYDFALFGMGIEGYL